MKSLPADVLAALASPHTALATLVRIDFPSGTVALNSTTWPLEWGGTTYLGANGLGSISPIADQAGELPGVRLELAGTSETLALAMDAVDEVQGSPVTISTAIFDTATYQILHVETDWVGNADTMGIAEDGRSVAVSLSAENKGVDLMRGNPSVYSDAEQQALYPGDRAFEYVVSDADKPVVWPSRAWYFR